jgi:glycosyltransferase involved in cell wall biosynthesis
LCRALAAQSGLAGHVEFPGFLAPPELLACYQGCQYAAVATNVETFGHCIVEPLLLGRVVLSRRVGVAEDVIVHGENGFFFDTEADLVDLLLDLDGLRDELPAIARRARECGSLFRWDRIVQRQLQEVYR